jgi:hypothetical protein
MRNGYRRGDINWTGVFLLALVAIAVILLLTVGV